MIFFSRGRKLWLYGTLALMIAGVVVRQSDQGSVVASHDSIPVAKQRLEILRRKAATVPAKEAILRQVTGELQEREKGIVQAPTFEQARAHLMDVLHATAAANGFDTQGAAQLPEPKPLGKDYGQVAVVRNFTCGIDQLVNFLSAIANQPEILATDTIFVAPLRNVKEGNHGAANVRRRRITKSLIPEKKGASF